MPNPPSRKSCRTFSYRRVSVLAVGVCRRRAAFRLRRSFSLLRACRALRLMVATQYFNLTNRRGQVLHVVIRSAKAVGLFAVVKAAREYVHAAVANVPAEFMTGVALPLSIHGEGPGERSEINRIDVQPARPRVRRH